MGLVMAPFFDIILAGVEPHETGSAAGTLNAVQQLGGALGIAILGTVFFHILKIGPRGPVRSTVEHGMHWTLWIEIGLLGHRVPGRLPAAAPGARESTDPLSLIEQTGGGPGPSRPPPTGLC